MITFQPIIKLTNVCNLNCKYCYYTDTMRNFDFPDNMNKITLKKILYEITKYNYDRKYFGIDFCLHGGEPTLYDLKTLENCLDYEQMLITDFFPEMRITYSLQSNGIFINDEFIRIIKKFNINIGISIDGPKFINDYHRGNNSLSCALNTIKLLKKHGISYGVLSVINEQHFKHAEEIYNFYVNNKIKSVGILKQFSSHNLLDNNELAEFLIKLFDLYYLGDFEMDIREFNFAIRNCLSDKNTGSCSMKYRESCGNYLTIATNGDIFFCDTGLEIENSFGNIHKNTISDIYSSEKYINKISAAKSIVPSCLDCSVYKICRTGCHRHDIGNKNYFCETYKIFYTHVYEMVKRNRRR